MAETKVLFIEALRKEKVPFTALEKLIKELPEKIYLVFTIQYKSYAKEVKSQLEKHKKILGTSQILGCANLKTDADAILLVGSGRFHALEMALMTGKEVYILEHNHLSKITKEEINKLLKIRQGQIKKILAASTIGITISLKPGQCNYKLAEQFAEKLKKSGKMPYIFIADYIDLNELQNYPIDAWVNTACPGLELDNHIPNLRDVEKYF